MIIMDRLKFQKQKVLPWKTYIPNGKISQPSITFLILILVKAFFFFECRPRLLLEVSKDKLKNSCIENVLILWVTIWVQFFGNF